MVNRVKELLKHEKVTIGIWIGLAHGDSVEIMAKAGFDWLVFDMEHGPLTIQDVQNLIRGTNGTDCVPMVRVAWNDPVLIKLALDVGAYGVVIPWVNTKQEAMNGVRACKYPPNGIRGVSPRRASDYYVKFKDYVARADEDIMVIPQIETAEAVRNIDEILSVDGIDAFFIGPVDLSASMGYIQEGPSHPKVQEAISKVLQSGKKAHVPAGIWGGSVDSVNKYKELGFQFIALYEDTEVLLKVREDLERIKR